MYNIINNIWTHGKTLNNIGLNSNLFESENYMESWLVWTDTPTFFEPIISGGIYIPNTESRNFESIFFGNYTFGNDKSGNFIIGNRAIATEYCVRSKPSKCAHFV